MGRSSHHRWTAASDHWQQTLGGVARSLCGQRSLLGPLPPPHACLLRCPARHRCGWRGDSILGTRQPAVQATKRYTLAPFTQGFALASSTSARLSVTSSTAIERPTALKAGAAPRMSWHSWSKMARSRAALRLLANATSRSSSTSSGVLNRTEFCARTSHEPNSSSSSSSSSSSGRSLSEFCNGTVAARRRRLQLSAVVTQSVAALRVCSPGRWSGRFSLLSGVRRLPRGTCSAKQATVGYHSKFTAATHPCCLPAA